MVIATNLPPMYVVEMTLKNLLKDLGIAPIILENWVINIIEDHVSWCYIVDLTWRTYSVQKRFDREEMVSYPKESMEKIGRLIASELYKLNTAKDEEHMEALVLLSMRPTNVPHN